jgi:HK97 family phage portal protein
MSDELFERVWGTRRDLALRDGTSRAASFDVYGRRSVEVAGRLESRFRDEFVDIGTAIAKNPLLFGPTWRACLRIGTLPISVFRYRTGPDGRPRKIEHPDHPAYQLLRVPNEDFEPALMWTIVVLSVLGWRKAGWIKTRVDDKVVELWPVEPWTLKPIRGTNTMIDRFEVTPIGGVRRPVAKRDLIYFRFFVDPRNFADGATPFEPLADTAGMGQSAIDATRELYDSGEFGTRWVNTHGATLEDENLERLERSLARARAKRGKWPVMEDGFTIENSGEDPNTKILTSGLEAAAKFIADVLGFPADDDDQKFYSRLVQPICVLMEQALERQLMVEWPDDPAFPQFGFREILKGDPLKIAQLHRERVFSGQETIDEGREEEDRPAFGIAGMTDVPLVPLNVDALGGMPDGETPLDTTGGLGGEQGKGNVITLPTGSQGGRFALVPAPLAAEMFARAMSRSRHTTAESDQTPGRARQGSWGRRREKLITRQSKALRDRMRGVLKAELRELKKKLSARTAPAPGVARVSSDEIDAYIDIVGENDAKLSKQLRQYMTQTSESAWDAANDLVSQAAEEVAETVTSTISSRADAVRDAFGAERSGRLETLLREAFDADLTTRDIGSQLGELYGRLADHFVDGIARTEIAFAHEQAALVAWSAAGIEEMEFVFGGGPCTTGVCEDAAAGGPYRLGAAVGDVGASFDDADAPPVHPNCTCFAVPSVASSE